MCPMVFRCRGLDGDLDLRADTVAPRDEQRPLHVPRHAEHAAEPAERPARACGVCGLDELRDAMLRVVGRVDVDAGPSIGERCGGFVDLAHRSSDFSKATSSWNSATRRSISALLISSRRVTENPSTTNEPMAEPWIIARRRLASPGSLVRARYPMNPPAKESPAPVGSNTDSRGYAGA